MIAQPPRREPNAFEETLLGLEYRSSAGREADLFSRACVEQYRDADPSQFGYLFAQVFEPDVLRESALLGDVPYEDVEQLRHRPTPTLTRLAALVEGAGELSVVELVSLAAALISISRFDVAGRLLALADGRSANPRETFEIAMLQFVVCNRCDDGATSARAFERMREAIAGGTLPPNRAMDACTQAVVWYLKRRELPEPEYAWFLAEGSALAETPERLGPASISSWYRGLAMLPAAQGDAAKTRRYMEYARDAAQSTYARRPRAYELHLMKTYYESSLKEHMFVTRDEQRAVEAAESLIALDPAWAPSYGEAAEAYARFGNAELAALHYDKAVEMGPPYLGQHLLAAAKCHEALGADERALERYLTLAALAPTNEPVLQAGLTLARRASHPAATGHFEDALVRLRGASSSPSQDPDG